MDAEPDLARIAALLADASRAAMLLALMDDRSLPASELARIAGIAPQTASSHLAKLLEAGLVRDVRQGRHRYFRLSDANVAAAIESLSAIAPMPKVRSLSQSLRAKRLSKARSCYDHLAGELAIEMWMHCSPRVRCNGLKMDF